MYCALNDTCDPENTLPRSLVYVKPNARLTLIDRLFLKNATEATARSISILCDLGSDSDTLLIDTNIFISKLFGALIVANNLAWIP